MINLSNKVKISKKHEPIIIAEISGNHSGSKKRFLQLIKSACLNGADLIKIQTYEPEDITLNKSYGNFKIKKGIWKGKKLWDLYKKACTPFAWHNDAFKIAKKYNKILFSSPFSIRAVDFLEKFNCKLYKIASFEITDYKLINYIASKKKPIIISTGMASLKEIRKAILIIKKYHEKIIILNCVSNYPTKLREINLERIKELQRKFPKYFIGLSDHTNDIYSSIAALSFDIVVIEKHFNLKDKKETPDSTFSILPNQLLKLKEISKEIFLSRSNKLKKSNNQNKILRRSIFAIKNIKKGEKLNENNINTLRPSVGICASDYFKILKKKLKRNIKAGDPILKKDII